ncbi:hypothetical protein HK102_012741, partial [Quaeritorhiza haematococci]
RPRPPIHTLQHPLKRTKQHLHRGYHVYPAPRTGRVVPLCAFVCERELEKSRREWWEFTRE